MHAVAWRLAWTNSQVPEAYTNTYFTHMVWVASEALSRKYQWSAEHRISTRFRGVPGGYLKGTEYVRLAAGGHLMKLR